MLGEALSRSGDRDAAARRFADALAEDPALGTAHAGLVQSHEPVAARGLHDAKARQSEATPRALLAVGLIVAGIFLWPAERSLQVFALLAAILVVLPMWQRGGKGR